MGSPVVARAGGRRAVISRSMLPGAARVGGVRAVLRREDCRFWNHASSWAVQARRAGAVLHADAAARPGVGAAGSEGRRSASRWAWDGHPPGGAAEQIRFLWARQRLESVRPSAAGFCTVLGITDPRLGVVALLIQQLRQGVPSQAPDKMDGSSRKGVVRSFEVSRWLTGATVMASDRAFRDSVLPSQDRYAFA